MKKQDKKEIYWPGKEWRSEKPETTGMDSQKLAELDLMINSQYKNINGIIIIRNGYIAYEKYYNKFNPDDKHHVASVTKSIVSALIGISIDKGYLKGIDQKLFEFFPEYLSNDTLKRIITVRHLLTMTAPFAWKTTDKLKFEPLDRLRRQRDWVKYICSLLGGAGALGKFQYCTAGTHLLSAILTKATGKNTREFANEYLFLPIGMNQIPDQKMNSFTLDDVFGKSLRGWIHDPQGITIGGWGLTLTLRDMARFGYLYLKNGAWENQQIISKKWINESTEMNQNKYGYLWWLNGEEKTFAYSAKGAGGYIISCIPEKELVVAITSKIINNPRDRWALFEKCIIPAVKE